MRARKKMHRDRKVGRMGAFGDDWMRFGRSGQHGGGKITCDVPNRSFKLGAEFPSKLPVGSQQPSTDELAETRQPNHVQNRSSNEADKISRKLKQK